MQSPSLSDLTREFARIGLLSFGGPAAQIALMHRRLVEERRWISEAEYLSALSFCMLLPGPEAMQLATWIGWRTHGTRGGLVAGLLFVLPGAFVVLALSIIYAAIGSLRGLRSWRCSPLLCRFLSSFWPPEFGGFYQHPAKPVRPHPRKMPKQGRRLQSGLRFGCCPWPHFG